MRYSTPVKGPTELEKAPEIATTVDFTNSDPAQMGGSLKDMQPTLPCDPTNEGQKLHTSPPKDHLRPHSQL